MDHIEPCVYCAGMGFEDYPTNTVQCRVKGHTTTHNQYVKGIEKYFREHPLPEPKHGKPHGNWKWTGRGWNNLNIQGKER